MIELKSRIDKNVIPFCLGLAFHADELRKSATTITESGDDLNPGPAIELRLETSAGDVQEFPVWQANVESLSTISGIRNNLLEMLESWLPESRLRWGEEVHLADSDDPRNRRLG